MNIDHKNIIPLLLSPTFILGEEWPHRATERGTRSLACPKGTIISCHKISEYACWLSNSREKQPLRESFDLLSGTLLTPLSNNFKVLCLADKTAALMANEETGKENYLHTFRGVGS